MKLAMEKTRVRVFKFDEEVKRIADLGEQLFIHAIYMSFT
jgi:hypothetical protein